MTTQLFKKIRAITRTMQKGDWELCCVDTIRSKGDAPNCPIGFVLDKEFGIKVTSSNAPEFGYKLGLDQSEIDLIVRAADNNSKHLNERFPLTLKLRRIFLKAAKLKEKPDAIQTDTNKWW